MEHVETTSHGWFSYTAYKIFFMGGTLKQTVCENTFSWVKKILLEILKQTIGEFFFITGRSFE